MPRDQRKAVREAGGKTWVDFLAKCGHPIEVLTTSGRTTLFTYENGKLQNAGGLNPDTKVTVYRVVNVPSVKTVDGFEREYTKYIEVRSDGFQGFRLIHTYEVSPPN